MELYKTIIEDFSKIPNIKTKDIDSYNKRLLKSKTDVSALKPYVAENPILHRTYFQVSLGQMKNVAEQFLFIERNEDLLSDWWHVDQLTQFIKKPVDFDFAFNKAKLYVNSDKTFTRRWGYVLFFTGAHKDKSHTREILSLMKNDDEYYVQMAQAWLIAELAVYNQDEVTKFLESCGLKYNITGKAIRKICESYRISDEYKGYVRGMRGRLSEIIA